MEPSSAIPSRIGLYRCKRDSQCTAHSRNHEGTLSKAEAGLAWNLPTTQLMRPVGATEKTTIPQMIMHAHRILELRVAPIVDGKYIRPSERAALLRFAVTVIAILSALAWHSVLAAPFKELKTSTAQEITALLKEKASWTKAQQKMESQLIHAAKQRRGEVFASGASHLQVEVQLQADGRLPVDIKAVVTPELFKVIEKSGGQVINSFPRFQAVRALVPLGQLETVAAHPGVKWIRRADEMETNTGSANSEGDITHAAGLARNTCGVSGAGVKVGVISDSVDYLSGSQASGDLGPVTVLPGQSGVPGTGEGTAMLEIIHDLAPGAELYFATADPSPAAFAQNILDLRSHGCDVIVDDVSYFSESPFQDGIIAQAVNTVTASGALYFSSAGNSGHLDAGTSGTWEGDFSDGGPTSPPINESGRVHSFGSLNYNTVLSGGSSRRVCLFWSDPLGASTNDYDVFILDSSGSSVLRSSISSQTGTQDPYEFVSTLNVGERVVIVKYSGAPRFLHLNTGRGRLSVCTGGRTAGHSAAVDAFAVAAVDTGTAYPNFFTGGSANPVETFSSDGPRRMFYYADGTPITPGNLLSTGGVIRQKPDVAAGDGVATSVPGFQPFYGTSAAAPHAAAIAALLKSLDFTLTPAQIRNALTSTALDIEDAAWDCNSGYGIIMADRALQAVATGRPPTIIAQPASQTVPVGSSATFFVAATGSAPLSYQWWKDGIAIEGATNTALSVTGVQTSDGGSLFDVVVTNAYGSVTSSPPAVLTLVQTIDFAAIGNHTYGDPNIALSATASSGLPVTFSVLSGPATISGNTLTINGAASVTVRAEQSGNSIYAAAATNQTFTVAKASQTISFASIPTRAYGDPDIALSANSSSGLAVAFSVVSGPATVSGNTLRIAGVGQVTVQAAQAGNANYLAAATNQTFTVNKASQVITFPPVANHLRSAPPFAVTPSASSGLPVSVSVDSGPATVANNIVTLNAVGVVTLRASQPGTANYYPADDVLRSFMVTQGVQTITFAPVPDQTYGVAPFALNASSSSGLPVTLTVLSGPAALQGNVLTITGTGQVVIRASQAGDANYAAAADVPRTFQVNKASQSIAFNSLPDRQVGDGPIILSATASSGLPVSFTVIAGPVTLAGNLLTLTNSGAVTIRASQPGNANYLAAGSVDRSFQINKQAQVITFGALASKLMGDAPVALNATASSGLPVYYSVSGPATLAGNLVSLTGTGTVSVTASQPGSVKFAAAANVVQSFTVSKRTQTITFAAGPDCLAGSAPFGLQATASSGLPVSYSLVVGTNPLAGNTFVPTNEGAMTVRASQAGDGVYSAASPVDRSFTVVGRAWCQRASGTSSNLSKVIYGQGLFVAVGNGIILTSPDGLTWTPRTNGTSEPFASVAYGNGRYVAGADTGVVKYSSDGAVWSTATCAAGFPPYLRAVTYGAGLFVGLSSSSTSGGSIVSTDGITWTRPTSENAAFRDVTYDGSQFVALSTVKNFDSSLSTFWKSSDGAFPSPAKSASGLSGRTIRYDNGLYWCVGISDTGSSFTTFHVAYCPSVTGSWVRTNLTGSYDLNGSTSKMQTFGS